MKLYKIIGCNRITYSMDEDLTHDIHPLEPDDHNTLQISHKHLCVEQWPDHQRRGFRYTLYIPKQLQESLR